MSRDRQYLDMLNPWLILKQEGKSIAEYLTAKGYRAVAVYGMALYGRHVIRELEGTNISIICGIDRREIKPYKGIKVIQPLAGLPDADVIINTAIRDHDLIKAALKEMTDIPVLCLEDIIFDCYDQEKASV